MIASRNFGVKTANKPDGTDDPTMKWGLRHVVGKVGYVGFIGRKFPRMVRGGSGAIVIFPRKLGAADLS